MAQITSCLLCCKSFESCIIQVDPTKKCELPLLSKFLQFVANHLEISTTAAETQLQIINGESNAFCEKCELSVVTPICEVYLQLITAQLRLSWELGQLRNVLKNCNTSFSKAIRLNNVESTASQFDDIDQGSQVDEFRQVLLLKCKPNNYYCQTTQ